MKTTSIKQTLNRQENISFVKNWLIKNNTETRTDLSKFLCTHFRFLDYRGKRQTSSCIKALRELEEKGHFKLPAPSTAKPTSWQPRRLGQKVPIPQNVPKRVDAIQNLELIVVESANDSMMRIFNELICSEHPQGNRRLVGRQLRYLIRSEFGWLGAIAFSSAALFLEDRDNWIGWSHELKRSYLDNVINMNRFLIRNGVDCKNLASCVLGKCIKKVPGDFEKYYGYRPWLVESFVDRENYTGACYKASNWQLIGQSKGRGRNDRYSKSPESIKDIYVYPLCDFRKKMGLPTENIVPPKPLSLDSCLTNESWGNQEFADTQLGDRRLTSRLVKVVEQKSLHPGSSYLQAANGNRYDIKGFYKFIDSPRDSINMKSMMEAHRQRTIQRIAAHETVLVIQDTSDFNYSKLKKCTGLGMIGTNQTGTKSLGLKLHSSFVVNEAGLPLGVLKTKCYAPKERNKEKRAEQLPIEEKESYRWLQGYRDCVEVSKLIPDTRIVQVMDREADIFELYEDVWRQKNKVSVVIRARYNRCLSGSNNKLFEELEQGNNSFELEMPIPPQREKRNKRGEITRPGLPARTATLTVRYQKVSIKAPSSMTNKGKDPLELWAVYGKEGTPPKGAERIKWMLLTTMPVAKREMAVKCIEWYRRRWRIEEWHRVIKTGCGAERHKHKTAERLKRAIAIDLVIAWRAMLLTLFGRQDAKAPADIFFDISECNVLCALEKKMPNSC